MVAILKNTTILALGLAMVVMLTSAAPLKVRQDRLRRQAPSTGNDTLLLSNVSAGLDVLYKLSVSSYSIPKLKYPGPKLELNIARG